MEWPVARRVNGPLLSWRLTALVPALKDTDAADIHLRLVNTHVDVGSVRLVTTESDGPLDALAPEWGAPQPVLGRIGGLPLRVT